jgi:hypothetical protein
VEIELWKSKAIPRDAGIGIFIVDTQVQPPHSIFIKAAMKNSSSVIMAEAAALALALAAEVVFSTTDASSDRVI